MNKKLLSLLLLALNTNIYAYDTAVPFTSGYFTMCTEAKYLDTRYYEEKARKNCRLLPLLNYEVIEYKDDKARITYNGRWNAWTYKSALIISNGFH